MGRESGTTTMTDRRAALDCCCAEIFVLHARTSMMLPDRDSSLITMGAIGGIAFCHFRIEVYVLSRYGTLY